MFSSLRDHPEAAPMVVAGAAMVKQPETVAVAEAGGERKRKKTLGRQKIEIKRINSLNATHVCFSKRRSGLYKKAHELSVLTGASLAIVVFSPSPAGKPYSLGYPSVPAVLESYTDPASYVPPTAAEEESLTASAREFERERGRLDEAVKAEKQRQIVLDTAARAAGVWNGDVNDPRRPKGMPELVAMLAALERVQDEVKLMQSAHKVIAEEAIMMQQCAAAASAADAAAAGSFQFEYPDASAFTADGVGGSSYYYQEAMDTQMMLMGGAGVSHGAHAPLPFAPMLLPPDLPPQPHFNYGSDYYNVAAGYGYGYGYDLADGSNHGAAYETEGYGYGTRPTTTCNFFG